MLENVKKHAIRIGLGVAVLLVFLVHASRFYQIPFILQLENIFYDYRVRVTMPRTVDTRIVILDLDEKSLAEEGHWPWPRNRMALLLDKLFTKYGIAVLGFDIVWAERDESSGLKVLDQLAKSDLKGNDQYQSTIDKLRPQLDYDQVFANAIKGRPVILGYYFCVNEGGRICQVSGVLPPPVVAAGTFTGKNIPFFHPDGFGANLPELQEVASGAGHFNPLPDDDGITRRVPMLAEFNGAYYESLSLAILRSLAGFPKIVPGYPAEKVWSKSYSGLEWLELPTPHGALRIPVDDRVTALVPFRGKQGSFRYISVGDVLHERAKVEDLKDKIVIMGATAPGLLDLRATSVEGVYPGVEIHANLIAGMLDGNIKQKPPYVLGAEVTLLFLTGLILAVWMPLQTPIQATLTTLGILIAVIAVNLVVWHYGNLVLPLASGLLLVFSVFALNMSYGYFVETRSKRQFTELFGQYVPPELVDEMSRDPERYSMEGRREELTVLFSDVRNFTSISEGLEPKELTQLMNEYLTAMTLVIRNHRGTVDKYVGDLIMAFWGAPVTDLEHANRAVVTAMEMQAELAKVRERFKERGWPELRIGVGVNTGPMTVGDMGSKIRKAYTVMGDTVNLGSRLEGITKEYGVGILVGESTRKAAPGFVYRELDKVTVKGKTEPVSIYEPLGKDGEVPKPVMDELKLFHQTLKLYRAQDWDKAELQLFNLQKMAPEAELYKVFTQRVAYYRANSPGPDWDGVFKFKTK